MLTKRLTPNRWMRDGKITCRQVGDSTRFWLEDLAEGRVRSTSLNYFAPKKAKFWTLKDSLVETNAKMCARCGDLAKLAALRQEPPVPPETTPAAPETTG